MSYPGQYSPYGSYSQASQPPASYQHQRRPPQPQFSSNGGLAAQPMIATNSQGSSGSSSSGRTQLSNGSSPATSPGSYQSPALYYIRQPNGFTAIYGGQGSSQSGTNPTPRQSHSEGSRTSNSSRGPPSPTSTSSKSHVCLHSGCSSGFARAYDLDRHMKTHFPATAKRYDCQYASVCGRHGEKTDKRKGGFTREDHYTEHLRKVHGEDIAKGRKRSGAGSSCI